MMTHLHEMHDSKFFYPTKKMFSTERFLGGEKDPESIRNSILSAILGSIYLHKFDKEIERIWQKHEITCSENKIVFIKNKSLYWQLKKYRKEASFNANQDNGALIAGRVESILHKVTITLFCEEMWY